MQTAETIMLTNPHDSDVCFKVKTTAPRRYCVRPNAARIPPRQTVKVEVLVQAMEQYPAEDKCKDKFLVQMAWLPNPTMGPSACAAPAPARLPCPVPIRPVLPRPCSLTGAWRLQM
jgi:hypothetical protein